MQDLALPDWLRRIKTFEAGADQGTRSQTFLNNNQSRLKQLQLLQYTIVDPAVAFEKLRDPRIILDHDRRVASSSRTKHRVLTSQLWRNTRSITIPPTRPSRAIGIKRIIVNNIRHGAHTNSANITERRADEYRREEHARTHGRQSTA